MRLQTSLQRHTSLPQLHGFSGSGSYRQFSGGATHDRRLVGVPGVAKQGEHWELTMPVVRLAVSVH